jgi:hypothetical protein
MWKCPVWSLLLTPLLSALLVPVVTVKQISVKCWILIDFTCSILLALFFHVVHLKRKCIYVSLLLMCCEHNVFCCKGKDFFRLNDIALLGKAAYCTNKMYMLIQVSRNFFLSKHQRHWNLLAGLISEMGFMYIFNVYLMTLSVAHARKDC